jgi:hypothetical protein
MLGRGVLLACALGSVGASAATAAASVTQAHNSGPPAAVRATERLGARAYRGQTSQHEPITFTLAGGHVRGLAFEMILACPSHHRYRQRASGFAAIPVRAGRFATTVSSQRPAASATVSGRVGTRRISGRLRLRRHIAVERATCSGTATFSLVR